MRNIRMFCISRRISGGERYSLDLLESLSDQGWDVELVVPNGAELGEVATKRDIRVLSSRIGPKLGKRTAVRLLLTWPWQLLNFNRFVAVDPDTVLIFQYKLEQLLWALSRVKRKSVMLEHGPIPHMVLSLPVLRHLYKRGLGKADLIVAASVPAQKSLEKLGFDSVLLLAGTDEARVSRANTMEPIARVELESHVSGSAIGIYAGRITRNKGIFEALELIRNMDDVGLVVLGDGPDVDEFRIATANCENVKYLGSVDDALPFIAAADFGFLLTTDPGEGRPLFGIECLSVGTPLIANAESDAVLGLLSEFGPHAIRALSDISHDSVSAAIHELGNSDFTVVSWGESASSFSAVLEGIVRT
jgi:glycosyltransferase involved in cell wall biosynthesis